MVNQANAFAKVIPGRWPAIIKDVENKKSWPWPWPSSRTMCSIHETVTMLVFEAKIVVVTY